MVLKKCVKLSILYLPTVKLVCTGSSLKQIPLNESSVYVTLKTKEADKSQYLKIVLPLIQTLLHQLRRMALRDKTVNQ